MKIKINKFLYLFFLVGFFSVTFFAVGINTAFAVEDQQACTRSGGSWNGTTKKCVCPTGKSVLSATGDCGIQSQYDVNKIIEGTPNNYGPDVILDSSDLNPPTSTAQPSPKQFKYTLLESFPGFFTGEKEMTDLPTMILAIYKFGIWTVGIAGLFMLVVGGFMYMASAGNTSTASSARGIITDSLIGIVVALGAYLILYVINPDLTKINLSFTTVNVSEFGGSTGTGNPNPLSGNCKSDQMLAKIKAASRGKLDPCLTFALLNTESGCTASAQSGAGACGIAQMLPNTAGISCDALKGNVDLSMTKGIAYFLSNSGKIRGSVSGGIDGGKNSFVQAAEDLYAGYNGGSNALNASTSCSSGTNALGFPYKAWDCTINPGGYKETQIAAPRFLNSYMACNDDASIQAKLK